MFFKTKVAVIVLAGAAALSSAAMADDFGTAGCMQMKKAVTQALDANQQSPNYRDAQSLERAGQEFCQTGLYDRGVERYAKALHLLGVNGTANTGTMSAPATKS